MPQKAKAKTSPAKPAIKKPTPHSSLMRYRDYLAEVVYDDSVGLLHGHVLNLQDTLTFEGASVPELRKAFKVTVEDYVAFCKEEGVIPERAYSGKSPVRVKPEIHRKLALAAKRHNLSLNAFVERSSEQAVAETRT